MSVKTSFWHAKFRTWLILCLAFCLFIVLGAILKSQTPTKYPDYISASPSPSGVKAFYTLLARNFTQVGSWQKPSRALPALASSQLLIMLEPSSPLSPNDVKQLTQWMEAGNRVWLLMHNPQGLFNLHTSQSGHSTKAGSLHGSEQWQGEYQAALGTDMRLVPESTDHILLSDASGAIALSRGYGKGELMVSLAPEWMTNGAILQQDNLQLLLPFITRANPKVIWFNDFIHGYQDLPAVLGVYPEWFLVLLSQLALAFLLWLWYKGKRFGAIQTPRESIVRFGDERILAIAAWYEKGRFYRESLETQLEFLRQAVQAKWGIPANLQGQEFIEAAAQRLPLNQRRQWQQNWQELKDSLSGKISQPAYVRYSRLLDEMQKEVEQR